jgi:thymidylate synthase
MRIETKTFFAAWYQLIQAVMAKGHSCAPRGQNIKELIGTQIVVENLRNNIMVHPDRDLNYKFMVAEWLWILAGDDRVETIARFNKQIKAFSDDGVIFAGAYGPRLKPQLEYIINLLRADPDSRQAVATIWKPCPAASKDIPCTVALQVFLRKNQLHGLLTMRSNDLWLGAPYDFFNFSQIVNYLAGRLNVETGSMTFQAGSSHIYERNFDGVTGVLANFESGTTFTSPPIRNLAPAMIWPQVTLSSLSFSERLYADVLDSPGKLEALRILCGPQRAKYE